MISVLICGYNETYERNVRLNIAQTIGCTHEILYYKNINQLGICQVYNLLLEQATGDILCFVHEDVEFLTQNWGLEIVDGLKNFGMIGIAGSKYKTRTPSSMGVNKYYCWNVMQGHKYSTQKKGVLADFHEFYPEQTIEEVVCIDGVFMCTKAESLKNVKFDNVNFPGFHGYDYDFSIAMRQAGIILGVIKTIKLIHFSEGSTDTQWIKSQIQIYEKWRHILPLYSNDIQFKNSLYLEFLSFKQFFFKMRDNKYINMAILLKLFHPWYVYFWTVYFIRKSFGSKKDKG